MHAALVLCVRQELPRGTVLGVLGGYLMPASLADYPADQLKGVASELGVKQASLRFDLHRYSFPLKAATKGVCVVLMLQGCSF
jgi:hypothetical protein